MNETAEVKSDQPLTLRDGGARFRLDGSKLSVADKTIKLGPGETVLLTALLKDPGVTVSQDALRDALYGTEKRAKSNVIEVLIGRLRRRLKDLGQGGVIETVRQRGYRFARERVTIA